MAGLNQDVPQLLRDLRHVYNRPKSKDTTPAQHMLRTVFQKNPEKFLNRLQKAEAEYRAEAKLWPGQQDAPAVVDMGHERAAALVRKLIADFNARVAKEDAEFAARPDAAMLGASLQNKLLGSLEREAILRKEINELRGRA